MGAEVRPCERVLVVNDNEDMLTTMRDALALAGCHAEIAMTSREAIAALVRGFDPNIFVLDLVLGGGERGEDLARLLRSDPRYAAKPIVFLSGDILQLRRSDPTLVDAVLGKPFSFDQLISTLSGLCARAEERRASSPASG